jgi:hypothetical protein
LIHLPDLLIERYRLKDRLSALACMAAGDTPSGQYCQTPTVFCGDSEVYRRCAHVQDETPDESALAH